MPSNRNDGKVNLHLRISPELNDRLVGAADERVVSTNLLAVRAIEYFLDNLTPVEDILIVKNAGGEKRDK